VFLHVVVLEPVDVLEGLALGFAIGSEAEEPSIFFFHRHLNFGRSKMSSLPAAVADATVRLAFEFVARVAILQMLIQRAPAEEVATTYFTNEGSYSRMSS
jgi:hypothetical protein